MWQSIFPLQSHFTTHNFALSKTKTSSLLKCSEVKKSVLSLLLLQPPKWCRFCMCIFSYINLLLFVKSHLSCWVSRRQNNSGEQIQHKCRKINTGELQALLLLFMDRLHIYRDGPYFGPWCYSGATDQAFNHWKMSLFQQREPFDTCCA